MLALLKLELLADDTLHVVQSDLFFQKLESIVGKGKMLITSILSFFYTFQKF